MRKHLSSGILAVVLGVAALFAASSVAEEHQAYKVGDKVEAFTLPDAEGKEHNLADHLGKKIIVLEFWNKDCPVSRDYIERMKDLHNKFSGDEIAFFAIDSNQPNTPEDIKAFAQEKGMVFPVLKDKGNKIADKFGAERTPEIFVIGKDQTLQYHGAIDNNQDQEQANKHHLADTLTALKEGKEVPQKETKSFGCAIKRE